VLAVRCDWQLCCGGPHRPIHNWQARDAGDLFSSDSAVCLHTISLCVMFDMRYYFCSLNLRPGWRTSSPQHGCHAAVPGIICEAGLTAQIDVVRPHAVQHLRISGEMALY
jgi:hypothetical protein